MFSSRFKKSFAGLSLAVLILGQTAMITTALLVPKPAEACIVVVTCNIEVGNIYDIVKDVGLGALRQVAVDFANKFLTRFVNKLQDKYKIRNYLYYDKILSDYYLSSFLSDKIQDPDLRNIYSLLQSGFVTGQSTGTNGAPDPRTALIPQLKLAINNYYISQGGIPTDQIYYPSATITDKEYFAKAQTYFASPRSFTKENLQGQFSQFQSSASSAAQLEIAVGQGLKASRIIGGTCSVSSSSGTDPATESAKPVDPQSCQASGGTWQPSALDQARSFIDNPTSFVDGWMKSAINKITDNNFDPNDYSAVIGSFIGNFLFNQLTLDKNTGVFNEDSNYSYGATSGGSAAGTAIDIDGDGIKDGYDINGDGQPDICTYGGLPDANGTVTAGPPCKGSAAGLANPPPPPPPPANNECSPVPTAAQTQEAQNAANFMIPLLNAIPLNPVVSPPPADYQAAVQSIVDQSNAQFPGTNATYAPYAVDNVIGMVFNYMVGPADHIVSNQVGIVSQWTNVWRVTCP